MATGSGPPLHKESWHQMKGFYKATVDRASPPAHITLKQMMAESVDLYFQVSPLGENIPVSVEPFQVEYLVPTEDKIEGVVR